MNKSVLRMIASGIILFTCLQSALSQKSIARQWNEILIQSIREDFARPPVHARNLFHLSVLMYDMWAVYDTTGQSETYFLGKTVGNYTCPFDGVPVPADIEAARKQAISYAAYRLLAQRFQDSPRAFTTITRLYDFMTQLGYPVNFNSTDYSTGNPAALGNYIALRMAEYSNQDGSNEQNNYVATDYVPVNTPVNVLQPGNSTMTNPNRWQPLDLPGAIDQNGNPVVAIQRFQSPEWGRVTPFALSASDKDTLVRNNIPWYVYHNPGPPPQLNTNQQDAQSEVFKWNYALVSAWSSHLDPDDGVMWDISPASIGNNTAPYPVTLDEYKQFYNFEGGGAAGNGRPVNPKTGLPYEPQLVPRGDYTRVLAQFWADGPTSETPPGHWFSILNKVMDHPDFRRQFNGKGQVLNPLEYDVKAYFTLGGALHDAAITAWGIKGYYDASRPVTNLRYMARLGQSSNPALPRYHPGGLPLIPGYIELVQAGDTLAGVNGVNVNKIKLYTWEGFGPIANPATDYAGAGWILAENWMPHQRKTFVTPPFAGYISGHSTYSRAAAEALTLLTGDEYFPGGMGEFHIAANSGFLFFEKGPSVDVTLQWATYRDASDQTSLSRIWGGIHPPFDDIPGRIVGAECGIDAYHLAKEIFYNDEDGDGYLAFEDCNDNNPAINPGAGELCNGIDDDCDGIVDDSLTVFTYYADADGDGFGNADLSVSTCADTIPVGYVVAGTDCSDSNPAVYPGAAELCDGLDNDCNGQIDDGIIYYTYYYDGDGDGFGNADSSVSTCADTIPAGYVVTGTDCSDSNPAVYSGASELCDGLDNDCNGQIDDGIIYYTYYSDGDGDGFGNADASVSTCADTIPAGYVVAGTDCSDNDPAIFPGAVERCDGLDNDCNGQIDDGIIYYTYYSDADGDGFGNADASVSTCADTIPAGYVVAGTDCSDSNPAVYPGAAELCDGVDNDCNGQIDDGIIYYTYYSDADGDGFGNSDASVSTCADTIPAGYAVAGTDCSDSNPAVYPGATELCDGIDNDCNGQIDDGIIYYTYYSDADGDGFGNAAASVSTCADTIPAGYVAAGTDCSDNDPAIFPGAVERCDGLDNDCNGLTDDGVTLTYYFRDTDGDGFGNTDSTLLFCLPIDTIPAGYVGISGDCNDANPLVYPGAPEVCDDLDNDCDGLPDDGLLLYTYYADADGDGYGDPVQGLETCLSDVPPSFAANNLDCDDNNAAVNPAQAELAGDGLDNDCDGETDNISSATEAGWSVRAYPNPVYDWLTVESELTGTVQYEITDIHGRQLRTGGAEFSGGLLRISFAPEIPGVYLLRLREQGGKALVVRVVKM